MEISQLERAIRMAIRGSAMQPAFATVSIAELDKASQTIANRKRGSDLLRAATQAWD